MIVFLSNSFNSKLNKDEIVFVFLRIDICFSLSSFTESLSLFKTSFVFLGFPSAKPSRREKSSGHKYSPQTLHEITPSLGIPPNIRVKDI